MYPLLECGAGRLGLEPPTVFSYQMFGVCCASVSRLHCAQNYVCMSPALERVVECIPYLRECYSYGAGSSRLKTHSTANRSRFGPRTSFPSSSPWSLSVFHAPFFPLKS